MKQEISLTTNEAVCFLALILALSLDVTSVANAASLTVQCKIGGARSSVAMRSTGMKGKYFVKIFSGDAEMQSIEKVANNKGVIDFRFDSSDSFIQQNQGITKIQPDFIKKRSVVGVMRKAATHAHVGGVSTTCKSRKVSPPPPQ
jgi:membrane carboxypeptidase/penicillin-binding protein PbpC